MTGVGRALLALVGGALFLDGAVLLVLEHFDVGTALPAALGGVLLALAVWWIPLARWRLDARWRRQLWHFGGWCLGIWMVSLVVFWAFVRDAGMAPAAAPPVAAIMVLGGGIQNGQPRAALKARLDTAATLARLQPTALIAVCGGKAWGEVHTEAEVMARYLQQQHGIARDRLVLETKSTSTELNLRWGRPLLQARGVAAAAPIALVTSDFHLPRALRVAQLQGFTAMVPVGAPTPLATRYNAWLREYFATLSSWVLREG